MRFFLHAVTTGVVLPIKDSVEMFHMHIKFIPMK